MTFGSTPRLIKEICMNQKWKNINNIFNITLGGPVTTTKVTGVASIVEEEEQRDETQSTSWQVRNIREGKMMDKSSPWTIIDSISYYR